MSRSADDVSVGELRQVEPKGGGPSSDQDRKRGQAGELGCARLSVVKTETQSFYATAVERTVGRITETLDQAIDLAALARAAALSPFHFHRVFRGMVGETPLEMHRRLRLE